MYQLIRSVFFLFDPERVHHFSMSVLNAACSSPVLKKLIVKFFKPAAQPVSFYSLKLRNAVGLGAGFDKNASYLNALHALGFGFVEIGTVTPLAQEGNEKPRLFRLVKDKAIINRMGFNNGGVNAVYENLRRWHNLPWSSEMIVGGNIGKNKMTPNEDAWKDYETCFQKLYDVVDYFVVNVSSPNTPGLRELQERPALQKILSNLLEIRKTFKQNKPLFLKIAPDLTQNQVDDIIALALEIELDGLIISNTTIERKGLNTSADELERIGAGGLSGKPLQNVSNELLKYVNERSGGKLMLIGSGGIFYPADMKERMQSGAELVQVWTGFIYVGPAIVKKLLKN